MAISSQRPNLERSLPGPRISFPHQTSRISIVIGTDLQAIMKGIQKHFDLGQFNDKAAFIPFTGPCSVPSIAPLQEYQLAQDRPRSSPGRVGTKLWDDPTAVSTKITTLSLIASATTTQRLPPARANNEGEKLPTTLRQDTKMPASVPASHTKYCAGTHPYQNHILEHSQSADSITRRSRAAVTNTLLDIKQKRSKYTAGVSNIGQFADLSTRGPGWWWKASDCPVTSWQSVLGVQDERDVIKAAVMWPSKKAGRGRTLRNIECRTGLTAAGSASEERILEVDHSQGILRKNTDGVIKPFSKPFASPERPVIKNCCLKRDGPNTFYRIINDYEGETTNMPIRRDILVVMEPRTLKTLKPVTNNRYSSNRGWAIDTRTCVEPLPSSKYYCSEVERFNRAPWEDREAPLKRLHDQQKLTLIRDKNAFGK